MAGGFESLGLMAELLRAIDDNGWYRPTDVQDEAIPLILGGGDVMAAAETGSGKTAAFCLPVIQCVHERLRSKPKDSATIVKTSASSGFAVKMNQNDKESFLTIDNDGSQCSSSSDRWAGGRATHGAKAGKYYYEATIKKQGKNGVARFGWSTMAAHFELGKDAHGFGYGGTGMKSYNGAFEAYGDKFAVDDTVGCYIDCTTFDISYCVNGVHKGSAFSIPEALKRATFFPALALKDSVVELNFGSQPFRFPPNGSMSDAKSLATGSPEEVVSFSDKEAFVASSTRKPLAIILEPARDLAEQVYQCITGLTRYVSAPEIKTLLIVGGDDNKKISKALHSGIDIIVGTLGKVGEMVKNKSLDLSQVRFFILDEADRLSDVENKNLILQLYQQCPVGGTGDNRLQVCFFSATLHSPEITDLSNKICVTPTWVDLKGIESVPETVHHTVFVIDPDDPRHAALAVGATTAAVVDGVHTDQALLAGTEADGKERRSQLVKVLKQHALLRIVDKYQMSQCMIFCRTNVDCDNLETFLCARGGGKKFMGKAESGKEHAYSCCVLGGMRSMDERRRNLEAFKEASVRFLICTDVAARGIDVQGLPYVINMTLPDETNTENYIHRIGRVGRAERLGLAISLVAKPGVEEKVWFHTCANRGKGCANRALKENGGCTIWQHEFAALQAVQRRLHMDAIPALKLEDDFALPPEIVALGGGEYGEELPSAGDKAPRNLHIEMLAPTVQELASLEFESQNIFLQFSSGGLSAKQ